MVVGGWDTRTSEESKEKSLLGSCEIAAEGLGGFKAKRLFADFVQFPDKPFLDPGRRLPWDSAGFELLPHVAEP